MHQNSKQTMNKNVFFFPYYSNGTVTDSSGSSSTEENNNKTDHQPSQFTCDFCSKFFKRSQSLRKHLIQSHPEEYCNNNNKLLEESSQNSELANHNSPAGREIQNSPNTLSPMSSPNSSTTTKYSIAELLSNKEPKPQQQQPTLFQCKICAENLPSMAELSQHITLQHISKGHSAAAVGLLQPLLQNQPSFLFNPH